MRRALVVGGGAFVVWVAQACVLPPTNQADGASCSENKECKSGRCFEGYCSGSDCEDNKSVCAAGWKCIHSKPDPISGFFGADGSDTCRATCGSCPGNQYCEKDGKNGETLCSFGQPPLEIAINPKEAFTGQPVKISASANGVTLTTCRWEFGDGGQAESSNATEVTRTFKNAGTPWIRVSCEGEGKRNGSGESNIEVKCQPSGAECAVGFCCSDASLVCLSSGAGNQCRVPKDPTVTITGPTAVPVHQDATYTLAVGTDGDGTLVSASWKFPGSFSTSSGTTVKRSFSKAGKNTIEASATLTTSRTVQGTLEVDVCQTQLGDCKADESITCCAPLTCKPSGTVTTYRCQN